MLKFAGAIVPERFIPVIRGAEPVGEVSTFRFPANFRRHYERLRRFPAGLLVMGDAMCSFNPIYGQGMTVAAMEAIALRETLAGGDHRLARRFFRATAGPISVAWQTASGGDLSLPEVAGSPPPVARLLNAYLARLLATAEDDRVLANQFLRAAVLVDPPSRLLSPAMIWRVVAGNLRRDVTPARVPAAAR